MSRQGDQDRHGVHEEDDEQGAGYGHHQEHGELGREHDQGDGREARE